MRHQRVPITELTIGNTTHLVQGSVMIVEREQGAADWEVVATTLVEERFEAGVYDLVLGDDQGRRWDGTAVHVRSVETTHVFRGSGSIECSD